MAKLKKGYFCQSCGAQHPQWQGQCNSCRSWNTLVEEIIEKEAATPQWSENTKNSIPSPINSVSLVLAALSAKGETIINRVYHLDRGFEDLEKKILNCGGIIERIQENKYEVI